MSSLLFLSSEDFRVENGVKGNILCNNLNGISIVLFYSTSCVHCHSLIPIFKNLPTIISGCKFGMINVSMNKQCIIESKKTIVPIEVVPYILLYVNGKPYMRYVGPHASNDITKFIVDVTKKINLNTNSNFSEEKKENKLPAYSIGKPLCGSNDKVCYINFDSAYKKA